MKTIEVQVDMIVYFSEGMDQAWVFGPILCDLWHSVDVLASTSSILHLCVISLDRWPGITSERDYLKIQNWLGAAL